MKYLVADHSQHPLGIVEGLAGVQQLIESHIGKESIHKDSKEDFYNCLEDFRIYELGDVMFLTASLTPSGDVKI